MNYALLGQRIKQARKEKHLTQEQLAEVCGLSASFLGHIERGTRKASLETLYALCRALNVSSDYLLGMTRETAIRALLDDMTKEEIEAGINLLQKIIKKENHCSKMQ